VGRSRSAANDREPMVTPSRRGFSPTVGFTRP
jgi:hypothetical protein